MITIGVTGAIGTGKSTVSRMFRELGANIIDADLVARQVMSPFGQTWRAICDYFGSGIICPDTGEIDRGKLGDAVFGDFFLLKKLNALVHPPIIRKIKEQLREFRRHGIKMVIVDAPLLIETGLHGCVDLVVVVLAEPDVQLARLRHRNPCLSTPKIIKRINSQMSLEAKKSYADFVVNNNEGLEKTRQQVHLIFREALKRAEQSG